jgi:hypothetical protein
MCVCVCVNVYVYAHVSVRVCAPTHRSCDVMNVRSYLFGFPELLQNILHSLREVRDSSVNIV